MSGAVPAHLLKSCARQGRAQLLTVPLWMAAPYEKRRWATSLRVTAFTPSSEAVPSTRGVLAHPSRLGRSAPSPSEAGFAAAADQNARSRRAWIAVAEI